MTRICLNKDKFSNQARQCGKRSQAMKRFLLALTAALLLLAACNISKPRIPSWDVDLTVPLLNERFFVSDLVDSVNIVIGTSDVLTITSTGEASTPDFGKVSFNPELSIEDLVLISGMDIPFLIPLEDPAGSVFVSYGHLFQGGLDFQAQLNEPAQITVKFPDIKSATGETLTLNVNGNTGWQHKDLADYTFGVENSGVILNSLRMNISIQSLQPDGTPLGIGGIRLQNNLVFDHLQGHLYDFRREVAGTYTTIEIEYPEDFEDAVELQEARVFMTLTNQLGFGAAFHGKIRAINEKTGQERWIDVLDDDGLPFGVEPADINGPKITELSFSEGVSTVLQIMPNKVELVDGYLIFNTDSGGSIGFVHATDRVLCKYQVDLPCHFVLNEHEFTMPTPSVIELSHETQTQIMNRAQSVALTLGMINRIPVGASITIYFGNTESIDIQNPSTYSFSKQATLHSSEYTGPDVNEEGEQFVHLALDKEELRLFSNPRVYLLAAISLEPSLGPVIIHASPADYIQIRGMLSVKLRVSE
jgi:hypothetical protein